MSSRAIAGGLGTKVQHGPTLPAAAEAFDIFVLTVDPVHPVLYVCNSAGAWVPCLMGTPS